MTYQEEKQVKMRRQSSKHAITLAMQGRWQEAVEVNKSLIEGFPEDTDAYNRLGKAYLELGEYAQAEEAYKRALELDPFNIIAKKNLTRMSHISKTESVAQGDKVGPRHFIEETGKSRVFNLQHPAPLETLVRMVAGDTVNLKVKGSDTFVESSRGEYLGTIEPKYGHRLIQLMKAGNKYLVAVVSSSVTSISIIVREVYQDPSQVGVVAFPGKRYEDALSYTTDKVFKDSTEYADGWAGGYASEGGGEESSEVVEDASTEKADHEV